MTRNHQAERRAHRPRASLLARAGVGLALVVEMTVSVGSPARATVSACSTGSLTVGSDSVLTFDVVGLCRWTVPAGVTAADVLVVAGGGGAASDQGNGPGAGGAGGLIYRAVGSGGRVALVPGTEISVEVGAAGAGRSTVGVGNDGDDSQFGSLVAAGGGGGGDLAVPDGRPGGSGGGASHSGAPGVAGPAGQGNNGGAAFSPTRGGGGGGAGGAATGSTGGAGLALGITGSSVWYALGGTASNAFGCVTRLCADQRTGSGYSIAGGPPLYGSGGSVDNTSTFSLGGSPGRVIVRYPTPGPTPGVPGTPTAIAGDAQATVAFTPPVGGSTPTSYTARVAAPGDTSKTCTLTLFSGSGTPLRAASDPSLTCTVTGLTNGTTYTFETRASTATDSAWSAPSNPVTPVAATSDPGAPAAPTGVTATAGTASLTASWSPVPGATGYTATATPGPASCTTTTATSCILGAEAGTTYTVTVVARSGSGSSPPSAPSSATTALAPSVPPTLPTAVPVILTTDRGPIALAAPEQEIVVVGSGFAPYSTVTVIIYSTPVTLGRATTDSAGTFTAPVTVPADLAAGTHTFLASGVDPGGAVRQMALPVTVAPTDSGSTGGGTGPQTGTLPVPAGGSITLLDAAGQAVTLVEIPGQGTYALDAATGIISFVPVAGFVGTATAVGYRITDAVGTVLTGSYTAVVTAPAPPTPPAGKPTVTLPSRIISSIGRHGAASVPCRISKGAIARCTIEATAVVSGRRVPVGHGVTTPAADQNLKKVTVRTALNALGRSLAARPGGGRFTFTAVVRQRGRTGSRTASGVSTVLAKKYTLPRSIHFGSGSFTVGRSDAKYLRAVRAELAGATSVTCVGHADSRGSADSARVIGARRAKAACRILTKGRKVAVHIVSKGEKAPVGKNSTKAGRARNRRVDVTVHN